MFRRVAFLLAVFAFAPNLRAEEPWSASAAVVGLSAPALGGLAYGVSVGARRELRAPFHAGVELAYAQAGDANVAWTLVHDHALFAASAGASWGLGAARLSLDVVAGALVVAEDARRQQFERLEAAEVPDRERRGMAAGPFAALTGGAEITLTERWRARLQAGPSVTRLRVNDAFVTSFGVVAGLGVVHAF